MGRTAVDVVSIARLSAGDDEAAPCLGRDQRGLSTTRTIGSRSDQTPEFLATDDGGGPSRHKGSEQHGWSTDNDQTEHQDNETRVARVEGI